MKRRGFTLIEVVLAIGLTAMVVYLLSTATELYLANVDASRTRVETAQLARTLLDQIAGDLANVRVSPPAGGASTTGGFGGAGGSQTGGGIPGGGTPGGGDPSGAGMTGGNAGVPGGTMNSGAPGGTGMGGGASSSGGGSAVATGSKEGVYGNAQQIRIDRSPYANWERATREVELQEASGRADMPMSVRYFFVDQDIVNSQALAQKGVAREIAPTSVGGLYRETVVTASIAPDDPPLPTGESARAGAQLELLAPEVVALELTYFDGTDLVEEWDSVVDRGLPRGVEILLTIAEPRFDPRPSQDEQQRLADGRYTETERVEYRRFVRLPLVTPSAGAQSLLPAVGGQGGGRGGPGQPGGDPSGQPGGGQAGGGQSGSGQSGGGPPQQGGS
jgi:prepilin-type N-terminal cleavage/methylation domain-containing protein